MEEYNILSIDYDFFIKCNANLHYKFDESTEDNMLWHKIYKNLKCLKMCSKLRNKDIKFIVEFINKNLCNDIYIADDHGHIYDLILDKINYDEDKDNFKLNVINIDFHDDCYPSIFSETILNCASWLSILSERLNYNDYTNINNTWVGHEDSYNFLDSVYIDKFKTNIKSIKNVKYDLIFICKSSKYVPPHLDYGFISMIEGINKNKIFIEKFVMQNRWNKYKHDKKDVRL